jgi:hypothetical protein
MGVTPLRCVTLARLWLLRGAAVGSFVSPAVAANPLNRVCPIRIVSVHPLGGAGRLLRVLFLEREGHFNAQPHYLPREEALILAANQQRVLGIQARVQVL